MAKKLKLLYKPFVCYAGGPIQKPGKYLHAGSKYEPRNGSLVEQLKQIFVKQA